MAEAFLNQLLRVENSVQPTSGECCVICLTECGTLCPKTGVVEWEIRLPCDHTVGSMCIATWLDPTGAAKNSCPLCRRVFFPAQSRPYLEHGIIEGNQNDGINSGESNLPIMEHFSIVDVPMMETFTYEDHANNENPTNAAWANLYPEDMPFFNSEPWLNSDGFEDADAEANSEDISSAPPVTTEHADAEANVEDISSAPPVTSEHSQNPPGLRRSARLQGIALETLERLSTPSRSASQQGASQNDGEELQRDDNLTTLNLMCETYCYRLNLNLRPSSRAIEISQRIAERVPAARRAHSLLVCAATAVYVASYLTGTPRTLNAVSMMSGAGSRIISLVYQCHFTARVRAELLDRHMLAMINRGNRRTVLRFMPPVGQGHLLGDQQ